MRETRATLPRTDDPAARRDAAELSEQLACLLFRARRAAVRSCRSILDREMRELNWGINQQDQE